MRRFSFVAGMGLAAFTIAVPAIAQDAGKNRRVQLIAMGAHVTQPVSQPDPGTDLQPSITAERAFRVHDLSRLYVEFRMANDFAGMAVAGPGMEVGAQPPQPVAPSSSIIIPSWMRPGGTSFAPVAYVPRCTPIPYQASGLLGRAAESRRAAYYGMMSSIACEHGIPVGLFDAMIMRESSYNPLAVSPKKAFGFAQLMPGTAADLGVDQYSPDQNLRGGAKYLRQQLDRFGQVHLALAAYNAGPGRVKGAVPRIPETRAYVDNILTNWSRLSQYQRIPTVMRMNTARPTRRRESGASISVF